MYKHILLPTDGSPLAAKGAKAGVKEAAKKALAPIESEARKAGVACAAAVLFERKPWEGILKAARSRKCDAIAMASHGRGGVGGLFLGSETQRVLAHSTIPVLVIR